MLEDIKTDLLFSLPKNLEYIIEFTVIGMILNIIICETSTESKKLGNRLGIIIGIATLF